VSQPRFLTVLWIDDRIPRTGHVPDSPNEEAGSPPRGLELFRFEADGVRHNGIYDWLSAIRFWQTSTGRRRIDLIAADVRFDFDATSPIPSMGGPRDIPTGLSHLKPFAAIASAAGLPLGIGIHTADPGLWRRLASTGGAADKAMGLLAAHEIGEVAAIMRRADGLTELPEQARVKWCWDWLEEHAVFKFQDACRTAVRDYRQNLVRAAKVGDVLPPRVLVMPGHWMALAEWCEGMRRDPAPMGQEGPGVVFTLSDGSEDAVWLRSLLADVISVNLEKEALPAHCYEYAGPGDEGAEGGDPEAGEEPWRLDGDGLPRIGALVHALRDVHDIVELAWDALASFPPRLGDPKESRLARSLVDVLGDRGSQKIARGLAVLFQILRRDYVNQQEWDHAMRDYAWDHRKLQFLPRRANGDSLWDRLVQLLTLMRGRDEAFYLEEAFGGVKWAGDEIPDPVPGWMHWHIEQLVAAGVIARDVDDTFRLLRKRLDKAPPLPLALPTADFFVGHDLAKYLMQSLGFSKLYGPGRSDGFAGHTRAVAGAFGGEARESPADFIKAFTDGRAPTWLKLICRDVAESKLDWTDRESWPASIR
jgi:hypothetical protein